MWFTYFHSEKIPGAIERYGKEVERIIGVIDNHLKKQGTEYLVGNKYTYADLSFIPWFKLAPAAMENQEAHGKWAEQYPKFGAWWKKISTRPASEKTIKDWDAAKAS